MLAIMSWLTHHGTQRCAVQHIKLGRCLPSMIHVILRLCIPSTLILGRGKSIQSEQSEGLCKLFSRPQNASFAHIGYSAST